MLARVVPCALLRFIWGSDGMRTTCVAVRSLKYTGEQLFIFCDLV